MIENATNLTDITIVGILPMIKTVLGFAYSSLVVSGVIALWLNFCISKKLLRNQQEYEAIIRIKEGFTEELRDGMRRLRLFEQNYGPAFAEKLIEMLPKVDIPKELLTRNNRTAIRHVRTSSQYSHIFHDKVFGQFKKVNDAFIKRAVFVDQVEFLLELIEPIEEEKAKSLERQYDKRIFGECRRIFRDDLKEELKEKRLEERSE